MQIHTFLHSESLVMSLPIDSLISTGFSGNIVLPESQEWTQATQVWGAQSKRSPKVAIQPKTAEDVSKAVSYNRNIEQKIFTNIGRFYG